jgi:hypothetical protein
MPSIHIDFAVAAGIVVLVVVLATAAATFFYRHTLPPVSRTRRVTLTVLRSLVLSLLALLLCEPLIRLTSSSTHPPVVALLIDNSRSMTIIDRAGNRDSTLHALLSQPVFNRLSRRADVRTYTFGSTLRPITLSGNDTLSLNDDATDISGALEGLRAESQRTRIDAAILLTDGSYTLGEYPLHDAEQIGIPLYTIGVGDSSLQRDLLVSAVAANDLVYSGTRVPVDITIKSAGFGGEHVEVILSEGSKELDRSTLTLEQGNRQYTVELPYVPEGEGTKRYAVSVSSLPGELTTANNRRSFLARVMKSKLRVLIVASSPSTDLAVLRQTISEEKNFAVSAFSANSFGGFNEGALTPAHIDSADCVILLGLPVPFIPPGTVEMLAQRITMGNKPLLIVGGRIADYRLLGPLAELFPFTVQQSSPGEQLVFVQPADAQRENPILNMGVSEGIDGWKRLPPIFKTNTAFRAKPGAIILGLARAQQVVLQEPLIISRKENRLKSLAVLGYGIWRWRLMAQGDPATASIYSSFLVNGIKWLTTVEDTRPVKVTTTKESFSQGEPVQFVGQVYDASARPVDDAQVRITARQGSTALEADLRPIGNGRYEGTLEGAGQGDHTFTAIATLNGVALGEDKGRFSVGDMNLEFQDTRMNAEILRQLADRSGGRYLEPSQINDLDVALASQASFAPNVQQQQREIELWNWRTVLVVLILLLAAEWFLRKRSGML